MQKLVDKFNANPTRSTAERLLNYARKHPFVLCTASRHEIETLSLAVDLCAHWLDR